MRGIISTTEGSPAHGFSICGTLVDLPAGAGELFANAAEDLFSSRLWFELLIAHGTPEGSVPRFVSCGVAGEPAGLLPLLDTGPPGRGLQSLTDPYSLTFRPLLAPRVPPVVSGRLLGRFCRRAGLVRLEALSADMPGLEEFEFGLRRAGLVVMRYDHFGNWYEPVAGLSYSDYLAARPTLLRSTIQRKQRRTLAAGEFTKIADGVGLARAIEEYEEIYARSWKKPEPYPHFHRALLHALSAEGLLRLGVLHVSGQGAAVQLWVVFGGRAVLLKLAHDEQFAAFSPGTVLTALMIERLLTEESVTELDFGRGDDAYKRLWTTRRRQRIGLMLANPLKLEGATEIGRWLLARGRRKVLSRTRHTRSSQERAAENGKWSEGFRPEQRQQSKEA